MRIRPVSRSAALVTAIALILMSGCGYHFGAAGTALPPSARTIYVETFTNHTRFTGINDEFMRYLKDEIANHDRLQLVDSPDQADLVLSGEITRLEPSPISTNTVGEPLDYAESLSASASLYDRRSRQVLWNTTGVAAANRVP
ncbi:MAG TPA: LptE family protein, partial [Candidatus Binataceae bacterium]|nr:LptE family protein [Candidatus Binataceae bacterium]